MFRKKKKPVCPQCGKSHTDWPAWGYTTPDYYEGLPADQKASAQLDGDLCVVHEEGHSFYFIRAVLHQKVQGMDDSLDYGPWVSLSEKSFSDYTENFHRDDYETVYFGWIANQLPGYADIPVPADVFTQRGNARPLIVPHVKDDIPLAIDYHNGISCTEAQRRVDDMLR